MPLTIEDITIFCKKKGFVYQDSEIYGSLAGFWDFGPLGIELKNNIKNNWWKYFIHNNEEIVGIDGSIITHPRIWEASGHTRSFIDIAAKCPKCGYKTKLDKDELKKAKCPKCGSAYKEQGKFNIMFTTNVGPVEQESIKAYLRPETAQVIFADLKLVQENARLKLPFGIGQIGKVFRNEISPRDFLYRSREFEQMELQYFIDPKKADDCPHYEKIKNYKIKVLVAGTKKETPLSLAQLLKKKIIKNKWHAYWLYNSYQWFLHLGINKNDLRLREHRKDELSHYAKAAIDIEYNFPAGWKEIFGSHDRGQFDLTEHEKHSKKDMKLYDEETKQKILPQVIESSFGVDRTFLIVLFNAYQDDKKRGNIVLNLNPGLAPVKIAVLPLVSNKPQIIKFAKKVLDDLKKHYNCAYDQSGSIGRRYARNDEIGTPFCITIDFDSLKKKDVTIRDRNTTKQIRVKIKDLPATIYKLLYKK